MYVRNEIRDLSGKRPNILVDRLNNLLTANSEFVYFTAEFIFRQPTEHVKKSLSFQSEIIADTNSLHETREKISAADFEPTKNILLAWTERSLLVEAWNITAKV